MKKHEYLLLLLIIFALFYYHNKSIDNIIDNKPIVINPDPIIPVVPNEPEIKKTDYEKALERAMKTNKKLLVIFTADWCGYCRSLKKDLPNINTSGYEICQFDVDDDSTKKLKERFEIKMIPCSIIIDPQSDKEIKKICGYIPEKYKTWLKE